MTQREKDLMALRTIEVSTQAALRSTAGLDGQRGVRERAAVLLDALEQEVIGRGADGEVLAAIEYVRRGISDRVNGTPAPGDHRVH